MTGSDEGHAKVVVMVKLDKDLVSLPQGECAITPDGRVVMWVV